MGLRHFAFSVNLLLRLVTSLRNAFWLFECGSIGSSFGDFLLAQSREKDLELKTPVLEDLYLLIDGLTSADVGCVRD